MGIDKEMEIATSLVWLASLYMSVGLCVAIAFLVFGIERVEPNASGSIGFRPLLVPGLCLLWPLVLWRWWAIVFKSEQPT